MDLSTEANAVTDSATPDLKGNNAEEQAPSEKTVNFQRLIQKLYKQFAKVDAGQVADYIPELAKADPKLFGIAIATPQGEIFSVGDVDHRFTIQSISKVFAYGLALEDHGRDYVLTRVGVEPTGDTFNAIVLDQASKRPYNPMVNAGAIATTSLIKGQDATERINRILQMFECYLDHEVFIDVPTFVSERSTGDRNRAMAYLMRNFRMIDSPLEESLDLYFQQCAVTVTCKDLALMAATLANKGVNPLTQVQAIPSCYVRDVLSIMHTCGMYNFAGEWTYRVGIPAKSGVCGGILAVVPGKMGIAVFSPPLDERGNSVRGVKVCEALSQELCLHLFDCSA